MRDTQLYSQILGIERPWKVTDVKVSLPADEVEVFVEHGGSKLSCPECGKTCPGYDKRTRRWRHLDTCQLKTLLVADVPRVQCAEHGLVNVSVPWAEPGSGFTAMFEALVIDWLQAASISAVADRIKLSWNAVDGIMQRAVKRGLSRREALSPTRINVDDSRCASICPTPRLLNWCCSIAKQDFLICRRHHPGLIRRAALLVQL